MTQEDDSKHVQELLIIYKQRLQAREKQAAFLGIMTDPAITLEIEDLKTKIHMIEEGSGYHLHQSPKVTRSAKTVSPFLSWFTKKNYVLGTLFLLSIFILLAIYTQIIRHDEQSLVLGVSANFFPRNDALCLYVQIKANNPEKLLLVIDETTLSAHFGIEGGAVICGLENREVGFSIMDSEGLPIAGAQSIKVSLVSPDDVPECISVQIRNTSTEGWSISVESTQLVAQFDTNGNARICGFTPNEEIYMNILDEHKKIVPGGYHIPSKGGNIFVGIWK